MSIKTTGLQAVFIGLALIPGTTAFAQKTEIFKGIEFDSSYCIVGLGQAYGDNRDSLKQFWFVLDNPEDMKKLKEEWVFKSLAPKVNIEQVNFEIYVIKDKKPIDPGTLVFPVQEIIKGEHGWYRFDTSRLTTLHSEHPLKYHTKTDTFDTFRKYVVYGNSIINDSSLLFYFEPSMRFEGKFTITAQRTSDPNSPIFVMSDINKELSKLAPEKSFESSVPTFDDKNSDPDKTVVTVKCAKSLYDKYQSKKNIKSVWEPAAIDLKTFWRD